MHLITAVCIFVLGTVIGSGINAADWRYDKSVSWVSGRSRCPQCGHTLSSWELIPVVSFLVLGGRCRDCSQAISWRYPLVELASGGLFLLSWVVFGVSLQMLFAWILWSVLLFVYVYDGRTMIIPPESVWGFNGLTFASLFVTTIGASTQSAALTSALQFPSWSAFLAGPAIALPFVLIWLVSGGKAMGLGDGKLALGIGWLLGWYAGISAVVFAFWIGAVISLGLLGWQRLWKNDSPTGSERLTMKSAVPFGPFLVLGVLIVYFSDVMLF